MSEEATVWKNSTRHTVTRDHMADHKMVEMNRPSDKDSVQNESIEVRYLVLVVASGKDTMTKDLMEETHLVSKETSLQPSNAISIESSKTTNHYGRIKTIDLRPSLRLKDSNVGA